MLHWVFFCNFCRLKIVYKIYFTEKIEQKINGHFFGKSTI